MRKTSLRGRIGGYLINQKRCIRTGFIASLIICIFLPSSFALSVYPQRDGNYTIVNDNGTRSKDISIKMIQDYAQKYKSLYWYKVQSMAAESWKQWSKIYGNGGNFR